MEFIKKGERVNIKLALPKELPWKLLSALLQDLDTEGLLDYTDCDRDAIRLLLKQMETAIRYRSVDLLMEVCVRLEPLSILQLTGEGKTKTQLFFSLYQLGAFLKKFPFPGKDTRTPALENFSKAERICYLFNKENFLALDAVNRKHPEFFGVIEEIREDILNLLGEAPDISSIVSHAAHGPGVSLGQLYKGGCVTEYFKWQKLPYTLTAGTLELAKHSILADPRWIGALDDWYRNENSIPIGQPIDMTAFFNSVLQLVDSSTLTTVPKTAKTDRTIAIEPLLNVFFQLGVDHAIRSKLKRAWGYDLNTQEVNQSLAYEGSVNGNLATIDLSMASDTISLKLCEMLLPEAWYDLLLDLRCYKTNLDGRVIPLEKISSMGNGYTFALESLIFGALTRCSIRRTKSERRSSVYGDDIILPCTAVSYLTDLLNLCGFSINKDKSFWWGPFRESCGMDFFEGYNVRPLFLKNAVGSLADLFYLHNSFYSLRRRVDWTWDLSFERTLQLLRSWIPRKILDQYYGPVTESLDTHVFSDRKLPRNRYNQCVYWVIVPRAKLFNSRTDFFFRKLMVSLRNRPQRTRWDWRTRLNSGNAFDVTKRGHVLHVSTKIAVP